MGGMAWTVDDTGVLGQFIEKLSMFLILGTAVLAGIVEVQVWYKRNYDYGDADDRELNALTIRELSARAAEAFTEPVCGHAETSLEELLDTAIDTNADEFKKLKKRQIELEKYAAARAEAEANGEALPDEETMSRHRAMKKRRHGKDPHPVDSMTLQEVEKRLQELNIASESINVLQVKENLIQLLHQLNARPGRGGGQQEGEIDNPMAADVLASMRNASRVLLPSDAADDVSAAMQTQAAISDAANELHDAQRHVGEVFNL